MKNIGATCLTGNKCSFRVWAPLAQLVEVVLKLKEERVVPLTKDQWGYHSGILEDVPAGTRYAYKLDREKVRPDPASQYQPDGPHGPSETVSPNFPWTDQDWAAPPFEDWVLYELHVGTFTPEATFDGVVARLDELKALGITTLSLMPVAQFPGTRNWGYDGASLFAVQNSYGGPDGLRRLVNECHRRGLAVVLDVVYNHFGPEGSYLADFGPYFTDGYKTPWGAALNFDHEQSEPVRQFFIENALMWITEYRLDGLRLDAVHAIKDFSAQPFLAELGAAVQQRATRLDRKAFVIAESDLNDTRVLAPRSEHGYELDAQWTDDFHHALHVSLTGERQGYYEDFSGLEDLKTAFTTAYVYRGQYSPHRKRRHGSATTGLSGSRFIVYSQTHDQTGNRLFGERLSQLVSYEALKLACATVMLSPFIPMVFMGEEYGEQAPFLYFISHTDKDLIEAVRAGRRREFESFKWTGEPVDPQSESTFRKSQLNHDMKSAKSSAALMSFYKEMIGLRQRLSPLKSRDLSLTQVQLLEKEKVLVLRRQDDQRAVLAILSFNSQASSVNLPLPHETWNKVIDSSDPRWLGPGSAWPEQISGSATRTYASSPWSAVIYSRK